MWHPRSCHAASLELGWEAPAFLFSELCFVYTCMISCILLLRLLIALYFLTGAFIRFEASPSSSCDIDLWSRKVGDKELWRWKGNSEFQKKIPSINCFKKPKTAPLMQNGELKAVKPHQVEFSKDVLYSLKRMYMLLNIFQKKMYCTVYRLCTCC